MIPTGIQLPPDNELLNQPSQLRFKRVKLEKIYFKDKICDDFKRKPIPDNIRRHRNYAIILGILELGFSFSSYALYFRMRSRVVLFAIILSMILSAIGLVGSVVVDRCLLFVHSFFTSSLFGAFYVYILLEAFFLSDTSTKTMSDSTITLIFSLPMFAIFLIGCHAMYFTNLVIDEVNMRRSDQRQNLNQPLLEIPIHADEVDLLDLPMDHYQNSDCIICMCRPRDSIFYPCGHECCCNDCGNKFMQQSRSKLCPICRDRIRDVIRVFR